MMLPLLLISCLDAILEAPYVLTTGLAEARSLAPTSRRTIVVATPAGLREVDGSGTHSLLTRQPVYAVTTHPEHLYLLTDAGLQWGVLPERGEPLRDLQTIPATGVVDLQSWCDGRVLLAGDMGLQIFDPATATITAHDAVLPALQAVSLLAHEPCSGAVVLSADALIQIHGTTTSRTSLRRPRTTTPGRDGYTWVIHGDPPVLSRLEEDELVLRAEHLGDPRDAHFGNGELLSPDNLYLADGGGTIDYARVITAAP